MFALTNDTLYLALTGEIWGVFRELYQEKSPRYIESALYTCTVGEYVFITLYASQLYSNASVESSELKGHQSLFAYALEILHTALSHRYELLAMFMHANRCF